MAFDFADFLLPGEEDGNDDIVYHMPARDLTPHIGSDEDAGRVNYSQQHVDHFFNLYSEGIRLENARDIGTALQVYELSESKLRFELPYIRGEEHQQKSRYLLQRLAARLEQVRYQITRDGSYAYKIVSGMMYIKCSCQHGYHRHGGSHDIETGQTYRVSHCPAHRGLSLCIRKDSTTRFMHHANDPDLNMSNNHTSPDIWRRPNGAVIDLKEQEDKWIRVHDKLFYTDHLLFFDYLRDDMPSYIYGQMNASKSRICWHGSALGKVTFEEEWHRLETQGEDAARPLSPEPSRTLGSVVVQGMCYLLGTLFEAANGQFVPAELLNAGDVVRGSHMLVSVKSCYMHPLRERDLVEMCTEVAPLVVTADHRVMTVEEGQVVERLAGDLSYDCMVLCSDGVARGLTWLMASRIHARVVALKFDPDEPVIAHMPPSVSILTKGQLKRATRRSQCRRSAGDDTHSMPSTQHEYSDYYVL